MRTKEEYSGLSPPLCTELSWQPDEDGQGAAEEEEARPDVDHDAVFQRAGVEVGGEHPEPKTDPGTQVEKQPLKEGTNTHTHTQNHHIPWDVHFQNRLVRRWLFLQALVSPHLLFGENKKK
jgi:hypothetical protein